MMAVGVKIISALCLAALAHSARSQLCDTSSLIDVFVANESSYFCIKIPNLILESTLLAFGEARHDSCSDYTATDLVVKRSLDHGLHWSALQVRST